MKHKVHVGDTFSLHLGHDRHPSGCCLSVGATNNSTPSWFEYNTPSLGHSPVLICPLIQLSRDSGRVKCLALKWQHQDPLIT